MAWLSLVLSLVGCGERRGGAVVDAGGDAGPDGGGVVGYEPVAADEPVGPALPVLTPCPTGWRAVTDADSGVVSCDPWPEAGFVECTGARAHFAGGAGCEAIGTACPAGDFADGLPAAGVVYVRAGEAAGGDGSLARPFGTIAAGVAAASAGDVVALSKGTFAEAVVVDRAVEIRGACADETEIAMASTGTAPSLDLQAAGASVVDVRIGGERRGMRVGADAEIEGVLFEDARGYGLRIEGGRVAVRDVVIRAIRAGYALGGHSVLLFDPADVTMERVSISHCEYFAVAGATLAATDLVVTDPHSPGVSGYGIQAKVGATVTLTRAVFERSEYTSVHVRDEGTTLVATDLFVRDAGQRGTFGFADGVGVEKAARVELRRATVVRSTDVGLSAAEGAQMSATDVLVVDGSVASEVWGFGGRANAAALVLERVVFDRNRSYGVVVDEDATLDAADLVVARTEDQIGQGWGTGIWIHPHTRVTIARALLEENRSYGLHAAGPDAVVLATDLAVLDTRTSSTSDALGIGIAGIDGASLDLGRVSVARSRMAGVAASETDTRLVISDLHVDETRSAAADGLHGYGLVLMTGAQATLTRARVSGSRSAGVVAFDPRTSLAIDELLVEGTLAQECADEGSCPGGGTGVASVGGAVIAIERFRVSDDELCGVQVTGDAGLDLSIGEVSRNPIGANVQVEGYDIGRLLDRVAYIADDVPLDSTALPVPQPLGSL